MKKNLLRWALLLLLAVCLLALPVAAVDLEPTPASDEVVLDFTVDGTYDYAAIQSVFTILNDTRVAGGKSALVLDPTLTAMAMQRAAECAVYYSHTRPDGSAWYSLIRANSSYTTGGCAENIAAGYATPSAVMNGWINSSGHYENLMNSAYTSVGLGCFYQNGTIYWVQLFYSKTVNTGTVPTRATAVSGVPIAAVPDLIDLYCAAYDDCNIPLYEGTTIDPGFYLRNVGFTSAAKLYMSGYRLVSLDTSIATTSGSTVTGIKPGLLDIQVYFGNAYLELPFEVLQRAKLSCQNNEAGVPVITCENSGKGELYYIEDGDEMWTYAGVNAYGTYTLYNTYPGEVYTFVVRYYDENEGWIEVSDRLVVRIPTASPEVTASNVASSGKIKLTWKAVSGAASYKIYRATSASGPWTLMKTATGTSYTNTSAVAGKLYYYRVTAVTASGNASEPSAVVSRRCDLPQPAISLSNVTASGKIRVSWDKVDGAVGYEVYRATSKNGSYTLLKTVTGTSFVNTGGKAGSTYYYKVRALASNSAANSAYSDPKYRTCDLAQPEITLSGVASTGKIKVSWGKVDGAVSYKVYRSTTGKSGSWSLMKTTTGTSYTNTSAKAGVKYYYKVIAIASNSAANSAYSAAKYRTCDLARPDVTITRNSAGKPKLTWDKVSGAVSYEIYRATSKTGTYSLMKTTTGTSYVNTSAKAGTTYYYKVMAVHSKSAANSAYSLVRSIASK